jgi:DNA helicase-2/ATP-dependent DNA helicase PcrA
VKFGELKFLDSAHVKDLLAALRFAQNPRDRVAGFRLMQLLPGVGPASVQRILDRMDEQPGVTGWLVSESMDIERPSTPPRRR